MFTYKNNRILNTIYGLPVDVTPIWLMRQAGRYLPEYRQLRKQAKSFMKLCKTPELACEVTLQPLARFELDAAILFSDILTIPDALGLELDFIEGQGPYFKKPLQTEADIRKLPALDEANLDYVYEAIRLINRSLDKKLPLIGFCGSPFTVGAYMVEGRAEKSFPKMFALMKTNPEIAHHLLSLLADAISKHLNAQIKAGVAVVMIFDTWGGLLTAEQYQQFSLAYVKRIISQLIRVHQGNKIPVILFTKKGNAWLESMLTTDCDVIGVDWEISLEEAKSRVGKNVCLQGNLNPYYLTQEPEVIESRVAKTLAEFGYGSGHIFNLGHGVTPDISPEKVAVLVNAVHAMSAQYHRRP